MRWPWQTKEQQEAATIFAEAKIISATRNPGCGHGGSNCSGEALWREELLQWMCDFHASVTKPHGLCKRCGLRIGYSQQAVGMGEDIYHLYCENIEYAERKETALIQKIIRLANSEDERMIALVKAALKEVA